MNKINCIFVIMAGILLIQLFIDVSHANTGLDKITSIEKIEGKKESCKTFIDLSKLIISLSTGVFLLLPSFLEKMKDQQLQDKPTLYFGLILFLISIFFGLFVISALAGSQRMEQYNIAATHIKVTSMLQWSSFFFGLSLCGFFLIRNLFKP